MTDDFLDQSNDCLNKLITSEEVEKALKKAKNGKAGGIDFILNEHLKAAKEHLIGSYVKLFNAVLTSGIIPSAWSTGIIKPIFKKKGEISDPDNYRGITILSCLGKLFTSIINDRLNLFANSVQLIGSEQAGFRPGFSTVDHLFSVKCLLDIYLSKGMKMYCAFVDYRKAFDTVWRVGLWKKLINSNIKGLVLRVIVNLYATAKSCVETNGERSEYFSCHTGVRQGENLSPFLFSLYLNDLENFFQETGFEGLKHLHLNCTSDYVRNLEQMLKLFVLLYADDTIILSDSPEGLQRGLNSLQQYCNLWKLSVNDTKTKVLIFSRGKSRKQPEDFYFGESKLEVVSSYPYLGVTLNYNGSFSLAKKNLFDKANRAMFSVISHCRKLDLPFDTCLELFDHMVLPILTYSAEIWGYEDLSLAEKLHLRFLKIMLKLSKYTSSVAVYGETGRCPLNIAVSVKMVGYWNKLLGADENCWHRKLYCIMKELHEKGYIHSQWIEKIRSTLNNCGLTYVWNQQIAVNNDWIKNLIKQSLRDQYLQLWRTEVNEKERCQIYRSYANHEFHDYLLHLPKQLCIAFTKFRTGNTWFPAVRGRNMNLPKDSWYCNLCDHHDIGDEFHYLLSCPRFLTERKNFLGNYLSHRPNILKFESAINPTSKRKLLMVARFCNFLIRNVK